MITGEVMHIYDIRYEAIGFKIKRYRNDSIFVSIIKNFVVGLLV